MKAARGAEPEPAHDCEYEDAELPGWPVAGIIVSSALLLRCPEITRRVDPRHYMHPGRTYRCCRCFAYVRIGADSRPVFLGEGG